MALIIDTMIFIWTASNILQLSIGLLAKIQNVAYTVVLFSMPWHNHDVAISNVLDIWRGVCLYHKKNNSVCEWVLSSVRIPEGKLNWAKKGIFIEIL